MTITIKKQKSSTCDKGIIQAFDDLDEEFHPVESGYLNYKRRDSVFIHTGVFVHDKYRRRGVSTMMYKELCKIAKECKIEEIHGQTSNLHALKSRISVFKNTKFGIGIVPSELEFINKTDAINHLEKYGSIWMISQVEGCDEN